MAEYIYKICVSYNVFRKLQECDIIPSLEENHVGLVVHISKDNYKKLSDEEKKNLEPYEVVNSPLPKQRKIGPLFDEIKAEDLNSAAEKIRCKMKFSDLEEPKNIKQKYYIPRTIGKVNTKKKGGR
ncbi:MAG: hypothetical protein ACI4OE_06740 [Alphaproteobacteria bacterium]|nr:hypothetical protein [Alphaproteobacteria bacterium]